MQSVKKSGGNAFGKLPKSAKKRNAVICAAALVTVILIVIAFFLLSGSETAYRSISIAEISGRVMTENNGNSYAAYENMVIGGGYALTTEKESYTRMLLDGDKYMKLEEQSHAVFENLGDPQSHRTVIRLNYGTFTTEITKPLGNNEDYIVNTPNAVLAVRGTFFRVEVSFDANGDAYTDVYTYGGAVACHRIMPDGTEVDEEVMIDTGYKARIKMDEIITVYVEELIEYEEDHVDPLEMSDVGDGQLVDVYNASAHGHEMFRSTEELWDEIVEREIDLDDYVSVYDNKKIAPYAVDEEPAETFVTTPAPETAERVNPPDNTETQQPESSLLSDTTGSEPIIAEASVLPAGTTAAEAFAELLPETDSTAAPTGNVAAETVVSNPIGTSGTAPTGRPAVTTVPNGITATTPEETTGLTEETEETEDTEETEESAPATSIAETATTTANRSPSAEIVTRPQAFTTSVPPIPVITTASTGPSHVHTLIEETVPASCTANGAVRTRCSVCGTVVSETVIPALGHNTGSVTVAAACEEDGERLDVCKLCGVIVSQTIIPATGHTETTETVEATCTASGSITVKCSVCGKILRQETIPMTDHIVDTTTVAATCEKDGERTEKCRICGEVLSTAVLPATGHTEVTETAEATCTASGLITVKCSVCGKILSMESIPVTAHSYETAEIKPASCTEEGEEAEICTVCGQEKPDSAAAIPKLPHTEVTESDGSMETVKCAVCGEIIRQTNTDTGLTYPVALTAENFPDSVFLEYVGQFDTDGDGVLSLGECAAVRTIDVGGTYEVDGGITSLKGIEYFSGLTELRCNYNSGLTELDVSQNTALIVLSCGDIKITELDVRNNTALERLNCGWNDLTSLDLSQNSALLWLECINTPITSLDVSDCTALTRLNCSGTSITSLDVSNNTALEILYCFHTNITSLDVSRNTALIELRCYDSQLAFVDVSNKPSISIINAYDNKHPITVTDGSFDTHTIDGFNPARVLDVQGAEWDEATGVFSNITEGTTRITYTYDCDGAGGHNVTFTLVPDENSTFAPETPEGIAINAENFPDEVFRNYVSTKFDTDSDGYLSETEIEAVKTISVGGFSSSDDGGITSMKGVEYFTGLTSLYCYNNRELTELDVRKNVSLTWLDFHGTQISSLDVSQNTELKTLLCYSTPISSLDVSNNTALIWLICHITQITELDVSNNTALTQLHCDNTQITSLDVSKNTALTSLHCYNTQITSLDISQNTALTELECNHTKIASLDVSKNTALTKLHCNNTQITSLDVSNNMALTQLLCSSTQITSLNVSNNTALTKLHCDYTQITSLDVSNNTALTTLLCYNTQITVLDVNNNTALETLWCYSTNLTSLDVSNNTVLTRLKCGSTQITSLDVSNNTALESLQCHGSQLAYIDIFNNPSLSDFAASNNKHPITVTDGSFDAHTIDGFDPTRVSDVSGAEWDEATGVFSKITEGTEISYTYDCDGRGGHNETFYLVPDENSTFEPEMQDDEPENYAVFPSDNTTNTPPGASDADIPVSEEGAFPSGGAELFSLLPPVGLLAFAHSRKRKTAFRFAQKAEIN